MKKLKELIMERDCTGKFFLECVQLGFNTNRDEETLEMLQQQLQVAPLSLEDAIGYEAFEILKTL